MTTGDAPAHAAPQERWVTPAFEVVTTRRTRVITVQGGPPPDDDTLTPS